MAKAGECYGDRGESGEGEGCVMLEENLFNFYVKRYGYLVLLDISLPVELCRSNHFAT
jgi:hypothetical protein